MGTNMKKYEKKFIGPRSMFLLIILILFIWFEIDSIGNQYNVIMQRKVSFKKKVLKRLDFKPLPNKNCLSVYLQMEN